MLASFLRFALEWPTPPICSGFAPSWYYGQRNAGTGIWVATGTANGILVNGSLVSIPFNPNQNLTTWVWVDKNGNIGTGPSIPTGVYGIAVVVSGAVATGGPIMYGTLVFLGKLYNVSSNQVGLLFNPPLGSAEGILSILDIRSLN